MVVVYSNLAGNPQMQGALRGMGAAAAGLIGATGIKMLKGLKGNVLGVHAVVCLLAITFIAVAFFRVPLIWAVLGLGTPAGVLAWSRLRKAAGAGGTP
jgi:chromate transporter